jgi:hypothetical protein
MFNDVDGKQSQNEIIGYVEKDLMCLPGVDQ